MPLLKILGPTVLDDASSDRYKTKMDQRAWRRGGRTWGCGGQDLGVWWTGLGGVVDRTWGCGGQDLGVWWAGLGGGVGRTGHIGQRKFVGHMGGYFGALVTGWMLVIDVIKTFASEDGSTISPFLHLSQNPSNHVMLPINQVSYVIGVPRPLSLYVDSYGTSMKTNKELEEVVQSNFDLRPGIIIR